jgi:hypothetical protein
LAAPVATRRRDGRPVDPALDAMQPGPVALPPPSDGSAAASTAAALAALTAVAAAAPGAPPGLTGAPVTAAAVTAAAAILTSFDVVLRRRRAELPARAAELLRAERAVMIPADAWRGFVAEEARREELFAAGSRARLAAGLPGALAIPDAAARDRAVRALLDRERRYAAERDAAVAERLRGLVSMHEAMAASPDGALWNINPRLDNCVRCRALAGRIWPWSVLRLFFPPVHPRCGCELLGKRDALERGLAAEGDVASFDQAVTVMYLLAGAGRGGA